jgi:hypothetical protein
VASCRRRWITIPGVSAILFSPTSRAAADSAVVAAYVAAILLLGGRYFLHFFHAAGACSDMGALLR